MNWDKAKSLIILFLLVLNAFLGIILLIHEDEHVVNAADVEVISGLLARGNIVLDGAVLPRRFDPVDQLVVQPTAYDAEELVAAFFMNPEYIVRTTEFGNTIFKNDEGTLTIMRHIVLFEPNLYNPGLEVFRQNSRYTFEGFINMHSDLFPGFFLDTIVSSGDEKEVLEFRQIYQGHIIMSNYAAFTVGEHGVLQLRYTYYPIEAFVGVPKPIISVPSALFMFGLSLGVGHGSHPEEAVYVTNVDIVQNLRADSTDDDILITTPYYRISSTYSSAPTLVNAITGDIE